jgi:hypothetical protein
LPTPEAVNPDKASVTPEEAKTSSEESTRAH